MQSGTKILIIAGVLLLAGGATFFFRKQPSTPDEPAPAVAPVADDPEARRTAEKPAPTSHLTGIIEPSDKNNAGMGRSASSSAIPSQPAALAPVPLAPGLPPQHGSSPLPAAQATNQATNPFDRLPAAADAFPSATAAASGPTEQRDFTRHRIVDGDTLSGLAEKYLGHRDRYVEIYDLNRDVLASPDLLPIGRELRIPAGANAPAAPAADTSGTQPLVPVSSQRQSPEPSQGISRTYRVQPNDTLSGIAQQMYGNPRRYRELFDANRHQLSRPEDLRAGTLLLVP